MARTLCEFTQNGQRCQREKDHMGDEHFLLRDGVNQVVWDGKTGSEHKDDDGLIEYHVQTLGGQFHVRGEYCGINDGSFQIFKDKLAVFDVPMSSVKVMVEYVN